MKRKSRKKQTYHTPPGYAPGWRIEKWSKKKALQLLNAYEQTDERTRVFYNSTDDEDGGVIGQVRVEGDILFIDDCEPCYHYQKCPSRIKFKLTGKLKIEYWG